MHGAVRQPGDDLATVGRERDGAELQGARARLSHSPRFDDMPVQLPAVGIPNLDSRYGAHPTRSRESRAIRVERHPTHRVGVFAELSNG